MIENDFEALLTFDKNLQHQQNFLISTLTVFVLSAPNNTYSALSRLAPKINAFLSVDPLPKKPIIIT